MPAKKMMNKSDMAKMKMEDEKQDKKMLKEAVKKMKKKAGK